MARLSGLASDHHAQGPGDAPRRKRGRPSKAGSEEVTNPSKRPASPIPEESSQSKKPKRTQVDDHDQLARELEESQHDDALLMTAPIRHNRRHSEPLVIATDDDGTYTESTPPPATQPAPGLTPHLDRLGAAKRGRPTNIARRVRMSMPAQLHLLEEEEETTPREVQFAPLVAVLDNRVKRRLRRSHLSEEVNHIADHKRDDAKLRKAYAEVRRQLREMEEKYKNVELELEATRLGNIDISQDQTEEHEQRLLQLLDDARKEIEELRASSVYAASSVGTSEIQNNAIEDDDDLILIEPEDLNLTQEQMDVEPLPNGFYATRSLETSQIASSQVTMDTLITIPETSQDSIITASQTQSVHVSDEVTNEATRRYEDEISSLATELGTVRGALRILTLQLQNMRVLDPGADVNTIITELRRVLVNARADYENTLQQPVNEINNSEFIAKMVQDLQGLSRELAEKTVMAERYHQVAHLLRQQNSSLLDLQADSLNEGDALSHEVENLSSTVKQKEEQIGELNGQITTLNRAVETQDAAIQHQDEKIRGLETDISDKETDNERLRQALDGYREDLEKVTTAITRLEEQHTLRIEQMENDHTDEVHELRAELDNEVNARDAAEEDAQQKAEYIDELEGRIERIAGEFDALTADLDNLRERLTVETTLRESVEVQRDDEAGRAYTNAVEVENLSETVRDLEKQLDELSRNLESERDQLAQTEADLENATADIEDLNTRIHDTGIQANELRSKLFQVQQEKEEVIAQLEEEATATAEENQQLLNDERQRLAEAEQELANLDDEISNLRESLAESEQALAEMTTSRRVLEQDRDEEISHIEQQLGELQKKYSALETTSNSTINSLRATITDMSNEIREYQNTIHQLENAAADAAEQHATELEERNGTIDVLEHELAEARDENDKLVAENESLAKRVEDEANELLNIMGSHVEESTILRETIATQRATIEALQTTAAERLEEHATQVNDLAMQIEELQIIGTARAEHIAELELQIEELKARFAEQAEDSQNTIDALLDTNRQAIVQQERLADETRRRTADALKVVKEMKVKGIEIRGKGVDLRKVVHGKVTKVSDNVKISKKSKRSGLRNADKVRDSGFVELLSDGDAEDDQREAFVA